MGNVCNTDKNIITVPFANLKYKILEKHNEYREKHNSPKLKINEDLCSMAQAHAEDLVNNKNIDKTSNYKGEILGQNIYLSGIKQKQPENVIKDWYDEKKNYDYNYNYYQKNASHFTQMVWKKTKEIGIGSVDKDKFCLVIFYYPSGNILKKFSENVKKPN